MALSNSDQYPNRCALCNSLTTEPPRRDCFNYYELESVQFPSFTFILCITQALFGALIAVMAVVCLMQGLTTSRADGVPMNCIDCSGIWMGICHVSWALIGICAFQSRMEGRKAFQTRTYVVCGFISISYDVVLIIISLVWAVIFFQKREGGMAAVDLIIAALAIGHGCITSYISYRILKTAPRRQICTCNGSLPSYEQYQRQSQDFMTMEAVTPALPISPGPGPAYTSAVFINEPPPPYKEQEAEESSTR